MVGGDGIVDPGMVQVKSMEAGTLWGENAAEDPGGVSGKVNLDSGLFLDTAKGVFFPAGAWGFPAGNG